MKKAICLIIAVLMLTAPCSVFSAEVSRETEVKQTVKAYFDARYKILSTLVFDNAVGNFMAPEILNAGEAINEVDVLDTVVKYRKSQINDLGFKKYNYELAYENVKISDNKAWVSFDERYELYFNCAPTVKNSAVVRHTMVLGMYDGKWLIVKDDYPDQDGIKKALSKYLIEKNVTRDEAKRMVLTESESQTSGRIDRLQKIMAEQKDSDLTVFFTGRSVAYAGGAAVKIDSNPGVVPVVQDDSVLLPARFVSEKCGAAVVWDRNTSTARITGRQHVIEAKAGEKTVVLDGNKIDLDVPVRLINGRMLLPAGVVADALDKRMFIDDRGLVILSGSGFDGVGNSGLVDKLTEYYDVLFTKTDFPRIDGSTATYPLSMEIGKELLGLDETGVKGFITHKTTHNAYVNLINGDADIIFVTQPSPEEYDLAVKSGVELDVIPICKEGFVFLVNRDNTVKSLTVKQVQDIYRGRIRNWKEVGGEDNSIIPYQREANSGSQTIMENTVMKGLPLLQPPKETVIVGMGELIDRVADYSNAKNALGYSVYYYATRMYQNRAVKILAIDGVAPDKKTISEGKYPFIVSYYAVVRKSEPQDGSARRLLKWLLGKDGQAIVDRAGFISIF